MRRARKSRGMAAAAALVAAVAAFFALAGDALSDDTVKFTPSIAARETYDSSVNFMRESDFEHAITPGARVDVQKERLTGWAQAKATGYKYSRLNKFDRIDSLFDAGVQVNATQTVNVELKGGVNLDHVYGQALEQTGELVTKGSAHQQYSLQPSVTFALTENNSLTLAYTYTQSDYDSKIYTDYTGHTVAGTWGYRLSERLQLLLQLADSYMENKSTHFSSYNLMAGFEYGLAETLKARVLMGGSTTHAVPTTGSSRDYTSYSAESSLDWKLERANVSAGFSRDVTLSVYGDDRVRNRLFVNSGYSLTERLKALMGVNYVMSHDQARSASDQSNRWLELSPGLEYMLGEKTSLTLGYSYAMSKDIGSTEELRNRNRVYLNFSTSF